MIENITNAKELEQAINKAIAGDKGILYSIGKYIAYNYYMCSHIEGGSASDLENEIIYNAFEREHPELFAQVEGWVTYNFNKLTVDDD